MPEACRSHHCNGVLAKGPSHCVCLRGCGAELTSAMLLAWQRRSRAGSHGLRSVHYLQPGNTNPVYHAEMAPSPRLLLPLGSFQQHCSTESFPLRTGVLLAVP